jgi:hypothetical protein
MDGDVDGVLSGNSMAILKAARTTTSLRKKENKRQEVEDETPNTDDAVLN